MNKERRKQIKKTAELIEELMTALEGLKDEEQEYYDNMPDNFQSGEKGDKAQTAIDTLEAAICQIQSAVETLGGIE